MTGLSAAVHQSTEVRRTSRCLAAVVVIVALIATACSPNDQTADTSSDEVATDDVVADEATNEADPEPDREADPIDDAADLGEISSNGAATLLPPIDEEVEPEPVRTAAETAAALGRGINFGDALEAPREGDWGISLEAEDFVNIAAAGFDHVRLPVSWAGYASEAAPFLIPDGDDPTIVHPDYDNIWERVDWVIAQAEANDLMLIVNMHHYEEAHEDPAAHADRIVAMWGQIARRYAGASSDVLFELFNEPHGVFTEQPELWDDLAADLIATVRESNPSRTILAGPVGFNHIDELGAWDVPDDPNLIATVHLYEPFDFTHQGASWLDDVPPLGATWSVDQVGLAQGFRDIAWDTTSVGDSGALRVDYSRQWAGFAFGWTDPLTPREVRFTASSDRATTIQVGCQQPGNGHIDVEQVDLSPNPTEHSIDLTSCAQGSVGVGVLNASTELVPVRFRSIEVCVSTDACEDVLSNSDAALRAWLREADEWSNATGVPVHLGEFGAFDGNGTAPLADRAAWTATVVDEASNLGMPFSYWEYGSSFGAYDVDADAWVTELRDALTG